MMACDSQANSHAIKGTISGASNLQVSLDLAHFDRSNVSLGKQPVMLTEHLSLNQEKPWDEGLTASESAQNSFTLSWTAKNPWSTYRDLATIDRMDMQIKGSETMTCYAGIVKELIANQLKTPEEPKRLSSAAALR